MYEPIQVVLVEVSLRLRLCILDKSGEGACKSQHCAGGICLSRNLESVHRFCQGAIGSIDRSLFAVSPGYRQDFALVQSFIDLRPEQSPGTSCRLPIFLPEERLFLRRCTPWKQEKSPIRQGIAPRSTVGIQ